MRNLKKARFLICIVFIFSWIRPCFAQVDVPGLAISKVTENLYVFTSYRLIGDSPFPANGLYMVAKDGVYMIDTPWDTTQFQPLLDSIEAKHHLAVKAIVSTHSHDDRTAGLTYYRKKGIATYTSKLTDKLCIKNKESRAEFHFDQDTTFIWGGVKVLVHYPGPGHSPDNLVIWFEDQALLFGGCLVKSVEATNLGNLEDADVKKWERTLLHLMDRFKQAKWVIPGHQDWSGKVAIKHSLNLVNGYLHSNPKK
ncbi:MAG: subclass B1 metallo-beta-lactamase [Bacteroidia bacterium]|nr:subclass B1 metallo-beta-lactamase [Bacteroidia bacterium]